MDRYGGSSGYRGRRRRSHRLRNSVIILLALLLGGVALANTSAGATVLERIGLRDENTATLGGNPTAGPTNVAQAPGNDTTPSAQAEATAATRSPGKEDTQAPEAQPSVQPTAPVSNDGVVPPTAVVPGPTKPAAKKKTPTPVPPTAVPAPDPLETANRYLQNWQAGHYGDMYKLLSKDARVRYKRDYFVDRYTNIATMATLENVEPKLLPEARKAARSQELLLRLPFNVKMETSQVGEIDQDNLLTLVKEDNLWRVQWDPSLIFKELSGDNLVRMNPYPTARGGIYDRNGKPLAIDGAIARLNVVPGEIKDEGKLLTEVSEALGVSKKFVKDQYKGGQPQWKMPIRLLPRDKAQRIERQLDGIPGVVFDEAPGRVYPQGAVLAQILGYVGPIFAEDLKKPEYADYSPNEVIGRTGLEAWGEPYLRGRPGGKLVVMSPDGVEVEVIKEKPFRPGNNIYLNIDLDLQKEAEQQMADRQGSIVALDPRNGEILTLASLPSFDPNKFVTGLSQEEFDRLNSKRAGYPFQNRSTGSSYPMASTFKPVTLAAALTAPLKNLGRTWYDTGTWSKLGEHPPRGDWKPGGHGYLTLLEGLVQSCDIVFYDLGLELYQKDFNYLTDFAKKWHLGSPYGVDGVVEAAGNVPGPGNPNPGWGPGDNVNLAIGQGALQISPLQAANLYASIGNGGTIYRPNLIRRIVSAENSSKVIKEYKPAKLGRAPVSEKTMRMLQRGLKGVTTNPKGTASDVFRDSPIPVAGKTGTGQQDKKEPYAWFSGYAPADRPEVTVVAVAENAGEGHDIAAPMVRQLIEAYLKPPAARP